MKLIKKPLIFNLITLGHLFVDEDNPSRFACPVCGLILESDELPYSLDPNQFCASFDICPCCRTQYGLDDDFELIQGGLEIAWNNSRVAWLNKIKIDDKIRHQLMNISSVS